MANEGNKPSWWQSAPGLMTATAAVIAAMSGLIGGLNQIGVFDRFKQPAPIQTASHPSPPRDSAIGKTQDSGTNRTTEPAIPAPRTPRSKHAVTPSATPMERAVRPTAKADSMPVRDSTGGDTAHPGTARPDSSPATRTVSPPPSDTASDSTRASRAAGGQIPSGTVLELAAANRICSTTSQPGDRVPATVVVPVTGTGGAAVPVGATAVLEVTRLDAPVFLGVRADSLSLNGRDYLLRDATAKVHQREFTAGAGQTGVGIGACIPAGGRITVTLRTPVTLGRS